MAAGKIEPPQTPVIHKTSPATMVPSLTRRSMVFSCSFRDCAALAKIPSVEAGVFLGGRKNSSMFTTAPQ